MRMPPGCHPEWPSGEVPPVPMWREPPWWASVWLRRRSARRSRRASRSIRSIASSSRARCSARHLEALGPLVQPLPHPVGDRVVGLLEPGQVLGEGEVVVVVVALGLHQQGAGEQVEARQARVGQPAREGLLQAEPLVHRDRHPAGAQPVEEPLEGQLGALARRALRARTDEVAAGDLQVLGRLEHDAEEGQLGQHPLGGDAGDHQGLHPVDQLAGGGALLEARRTSAARRRPRGRRPAGPRRGRGWCTRTMRSISAGAGKAM